MFGDHLTYVCGFVNSVVFDYYNRMLCKQITKSGDSVNLVPFIMETNHKKSRILLKVRFPYPKTTGIPMKPHGILSVIR